VNTREQSSGTLHRECESVSFRETWTGVATRYCAVIPSNALRKDLRQKEVRGVFPHASDDKSSVVQFHSHRVADANTRCILSQCSIALSTSQRLEKGSERRNWKLKLESVLSRSSLLFHRHSRFYFFFFQLVNYRCFFHPHSSTTRALFCIKIERITEVIGDVLESLCISTKPLLSFRYWRIMT